VPYKALVPFIPLRSGAKVPQKGKLSVQSPTELVLQSRCFAPSATFFRTTLKVLGFQPRRKSMGASP
jgi:hypothetical protein